MNSKTWTQTELRNDFPAVQNLGELVTQITHSAETRGEVLCEIRVNDLVLSESEESKFQLTPLETIQSLEAKFSSPADLLQESLGTCREYLQRLLGAFEKVSELFRKEDLAEAHSFYQSCINGADWFVQLLTHYKVVYQSIRGPIPLGWLQLEAKLIEVLSQVLDAYEKKDFILLADLLEYEVTTVLQAWTQHLDSLGGIHQPTQGSHSEDSHHR